MGKRVGLVLAYVLFLVVLLETASRAYLCMKQGARFWNPGAVVYKFYPELLEAVRTPMGPDDGRLDILLLGASVLDPEYGDIARRLENELRAALGRDVRIYNMGRSSHTSRDIYYDYLALRQKPFDLVVFYEGINDLRLNNCSPSFFKPDYSHDLWHAAVNLFHRHAGICWFTLPYTLDYVVLRLRERLGVDHYLPGTRLGPEWLAQGADNKVAATYRQNVSRLLDISRDKGERVLLVSYVCHMPPGYTQGAFLGRRLDYVDYILPVEFWGLPEVIAAGIEMNNRTLEELASSYPLATFWDQAALMPGEGRYFDDICHLSDEGCRVFVDNLLPVVLALATNTTPGVSGGRTPPKNEGIVL
ncbi:MAG: SGNH/GDSL hydrolase family protein [Kiritimatiellae bacterium]|nr:SGNH/GDSL hydrolase family protein [Kiritimatiellia bacterium]